MKPNIQRLRLTLFLLLFALTSYAINNDTTVTFSTQGGFYDTSFSLALTCPENLVIHYTLNGNTPTIKDAVYSQPLFLDQKLYSKSNIYTIQTCPDSAWFVPESVQKCIIIRAAAFDSDGNHVGATTTNSYFIKSLDDYPNDLPVVSLCADSTALFGYEEGIYLQGGAHNNCFQHGRDWERLCNIEFYEHDNSGINQLAGLRMHGNAARSGTQKVMKVYARKEYGEKRFCHKFFETTEIRCFKHLTLKPLKDESYFGDFLCNRLAYSVNAETMADRPVVLYLNGEYWGIYFLKEKPDAQYISEHFGYDKNDVNVIESWYGHVADGKNDNFVAMMRWFINSDLTEDESYKKACQLIDIDCFIDYYCFYIFTGISDWPDGNMRCWQARDGKWRWIFYDGDGGCGPFYPNTFRLAIDNFGRTVAPVLMFSKLLTNPDFRDKFYCRYGNLLANELSYANTSRVFEVCLTPLTGEIDRQLARFSPNGKGAWERYIHLTDIFLKHRIVSAAGMAYSIWSYNNWEYRLSANAKQSRFKYNPKSSRPTYLLRMWKQFDNSAYLKTYFSYEPYRIRERMKDTRLYQYLNRKLKS